MKKLAYTLIAIAIFTTASLAQDIDKPTQARWHVAQALLSREWPAEQRAFLLRAATEPTAGMEAEARALFPAPEFTDIFLKIGKHETGKYKEVRDLDDLAGKKKLMRSLTGEGKALVWRTHLAYIIASKKLTPEQQELIVDAAAYSGDPTEERGSELGRRSHELFGPEGREIFGTIGAFKSVGTLCPDAVTAKAVDEPIALMPPPPGDCVCSVNGSNWSCYDTCYSSSGCARTEGCGFMWMWQCNGTCRT